MKQLLPILLLIFSMSASALATDTALTITPSKILTGEDQAVFFSIAVDCQRGTCPENIELIQWENETRQKVKFRWSIQDKGLWGDRQAGDKIYSRQAFFKEHFASTLFFTAGVTHDAELEIIPRPTFLELLLNIFKRGS